MDLTYSDVLPTNPEGSIVRIEDGTTIYIRALQGHSHGVETNPNLLSLKRIPLNWKRTSIPHGQIFQLQINPRGCSMDRRIESKKHKTSLFLLTSESARTVIKTAYDRLERTR